MIALRRNPAPDEQDLNVPRCLFEALGIDIFQGLAFEDRIAFLGQVLKGTAPKRRWWRERIENGRAEGRFEELIGEIDQVEAGPAGVRVHVGSRHGEDPGWLDVTGVCAGTGFVKSALALPLLRRLVEFYEIPVGRRAHPAQVQLRRAGARPARLAPVHDGPDRQHRDPARRHDRRASSTSGGGSSATSTRPSPPKKRPFPSRLGMQLSLARDTAKAIRTVRRVEQLA